MVINQYFFHDVYVNIMPAHEKNIKTFGITGDFVIHRRLGINEHG
jgi:hypothetical protein